MSSRPYLGGGILVAFHAVQCVLCGINGELGRVVTAAPNVQSQRMFSGAIAGSAEMTK